MRDIINKMADKNIGSLCLFLKNKNNIDYLNYLNNSLSNELIHLDISEKLFYFRNNINSLLKCFCGKKLSYIGFKNGYRKSCGDKKCYTDIRKKTCIENWGVDNPKKSDLVIQREKLNIKEKWGDHFMLNESVREKFKNTMISNWGVEWAQQSDIITNKSKKTFDENPNKLDIIKRRSSKLLEKTISEKKIINDKKIKSIIEKWGNYENFIDFRLNKIKESSIKKNGTIHHLGCKSVIEKRIKTFKDNNINKIISKLPNDISYNDKFLNKNNTDYIFNLKCGICNDNFDINRQFLYFRILNNVNVCLRCNPVLVGKSKREKELLDFIKTFDLNIISNDRENIKKELDIYIPDLKIAFEFNGLYWHSDLYKDKIYHRNKTKECEKLGIQLIHIWEDDWDYKKDIIKSIIKNKLGKSKRIFARKCIIKEITDNNLIRDFLNKNHIQGFVGSNKKIGLYYEDELVSIMTFGGLRKSLGQKSKENSYELLRFCNKLNYSVVGGASKLFNYFITNYEFNDIISYSDNSRGIGNLYNKLGFSFISESIPNYYWIIDGIRKNRFNYRKDKLVSEGFDSNKTEIEIMKSRGYNRVFDCGSKKWIFENKKTNK